MDVLRTPAAYALHTGILEAMHPARRARREHLLEAIVEAVFGREHEHVRDVVEEARARAVVAHVTVAHAAREEMNDTVDLDGARIENGAIPRNRTVFDHRRVTDAPRREYERASQRRPVHLVNLYRTDRMVEMVPRNPRSCSYGSH